MRHSNSRPSAAKPRVPRDFPLWLHPSGRWCKKIRQRVHYFGKADDPDAALAEWLRVKDSLLAGRTPPPKDGGLTVVKLADEFLKHKQALLDSGEITQRTFDRYYATARELVKLLGRDTQVDTLTVRDLEGVRAAFAKRWGVVSLGNELSIVRSIFKYAFDAAILDRPVRTGSALRRPAARLVRANRAKALRMFEREELAAVLAKAGPIMRAITLLGIQCGHGNADIASLTVAQVERGIKTGWIDYARGKTGVGRRCPLWKETREALEAALDARPRPQGPEAEALAFLRQDGKPMDPDRRGVYLAGWFTRVVKLAGVHRPGLNFYALRHTTQTAGETAGDLPALDAILGHVPPQNDMRATYRERIDDGRLQRVVDAIHAWLYPPAAQEGGPAVVPFSKATG